MANKNPLENLLPQDVDRFSQLEVEPFQFTDPERHEMAVQETMDVILAIDPPTDQHFSALLMNRDYLSDEATPIVAPGPYIGSVVNPERKYEAYQLAAAFPDRPILVIDMPAHGLSSKFTSEQKREMFKHKSIARVAQALLGAAHQRLPNNETFDIAGTSAGGLAGIEMARHANSLGLKPNVLVAHESAGLHKRPSLMLARGFFWLEWRDQKHYHTDPIGEHLRKSYETFVDDLRRHGYKDEDYMGYAGVYSKDGLFVASNFISRNPLATDQGFKSLEEALDKNPNLAAGLVNGGLSNISKIKKIQPEIDKLKDKFGDRLIWQIWPEDNHGMGLADQLPRLASFTKYIIDHYEEKPEKS